MSATEFFWYITCQHCGFVESYPTKRERDARYVQHCAAHDASTYAIEN